MRTSRFTQRLFYLFVGLLTLPVILAVSALTFNERVDMVTGITYMPGCSHLLTATTGARYWLLPSARMLAWEVHTGFGVGFGG